MVLGDVDNRSCHLLGDRLTDRGSWASGYKAHDFHFLALRANCAFLRIAGLPDLAARRSLDTGIFWPFLAFRAERREPCLDFLILMPGLRLRAIRQRLPAHEADALGANIAWRWAHVALRCADQLVPNVTHRFLVARLRLRFLVEPPRPLLSALRCEPGASPLPKDWGPAEGEKFMP